MKLLQNLFFYVEFNISSVALVLRLAGLLSHSFTINTGMMLWLSYFINTNPFNIMYLPAPYNS